MDNDLPLEDGFFERDGKLCYKHGDQILIGMVPMAVESFSSTNEEVNLAGKPTTFTLDFAPVQPVEPPAYEVLIEHGEIVVDNRWSSYLETVRGMSQSGRNLTMAIYAPGSFDKVKHND